MAPRLLICGFGAFPNFPANPSGLAVERLRAQAWAPAGTVAGYAVLPTTWTGATTTLRARLQETETHAVLLTGVAGSARAFRVETRALNRASTTAPDADGLCRADAVIAATGPAELAAAAPVEAMLAAVRAAGLPAEASLSAGDYLCNFTFYSLLHVASTTRLVAFLHLPPAPEAPPDQAEGGRCFGLGDLTVGIQAAAEALAGALAKPARTGLNEFP